MCPGVTKGRRGADASIPVTGIVTIRYSRI